MSTRNMTFIAMLVFAITLALVIGSNLPTETMPVVLGVALGVMVSVPTSALVAIASRRAVPQLHFEPESGPEPGSAGRTRRAKRAASSEERPRRDRERQFTIVGGAGPPVLEEDDFSGNGNHY